MACWTAPGCSCRAAYRCARPPATPAPRTGPGSSPRQRLDHRRRQCRRNRARYPNPHLAGQLDFDCRLSARRIARRRVGRRDQHRRKPLRDGAQFLPPAIDLPSADIGATGNIADHRPRRQALGNDRPFCSSDQRRRRSGPVKTSTRAIAPSLALVQALSFAPMLPDDPHQPLQRKAPLSGRLLFFSPVSPDFQAASSRRRQAFP